MSLTLKLDTLALDHRKNQLEVQRNNEDSLWTTKCLVYNLPTFRLDALFIVRVGDNIILVSHIFPIQKVRTYPIIHYSGENYIFLCRHQILNYASHNKFKLIQTGRLRTIHDLHPCTSLTTSYTESDSGLIASVVNTTLSSYKHLGIFVSSYPYFVTVLYILYYTENLALSRPV